MKNVIGYGRVSTEEQSTYGYSLRHQKEYIEKWCVAKGYNLIEYYEDDCSGQNFKRPNYKLLKGYIKKHKKEIDYVISLKWDRFARNVKEALIEIDNLKELNVEVNTAEQPIDFSQPTYVLQLTIYLAQGEVEVKQTSIRVKEGMLKARKEGHCMGSAPFGYSHEKHPVLEKSYLVPNKDAAMVKEAFELMATGTLSGDMVRRRIGYKKGRSAFYAMLKNRVYVGKIKVPAYKDEPSFYAEGLQEPIIDIPTFNKVQDILSGRATKPNPKYSKKRDELYLRGYLTCPVCKGNLTGSPSKGNGGNYYYYHCNHAGHTPSFNNIKTHDSFADYLKMFIPSNEMLSLYNEVLKDVSTERKGSFVEQSKKVQAEIDIIQSRLNTLEDKWIDGNTSDADYHRIKDRLNENKRTLESKKQELLSIDTNFNDKLNYGMSLLKNLPKYFTDADIDTKQELIGLIFPEKLQFDGKKYQTTKINDVFALMIQENKQLQKRHIAQNDGMSCRVTPTGLKPVTYRTGICRSIH